MGLGRRLALVWLRPWLRRCTLRAVRVPVAEQHHRRARRRVRGDTIHPALITFLKMLKLSACSQLELDLDSRGVRRRSRGRRGPVRAGGARVVRVADGAARRHTGTEVRVLQAAHAESRLYVPVPGL